MRHSPEPSKWVTLESIQSKYTKCKVHSLVMIQICPIRHFRLFLPIEEGDSLLACELAWFIFIWFEVHQYKIICSICESLEYIIVLECWSFTGSLLFF